MSAVRKAVPPEPAPRDEELRAFLLVLRRALLMICAYIERRYGG